MIRLVGDKSNGFKLNGIHAQRSKAFKRPAIPWVDVSDDDDRRKKRPLVKSTVGITNATKFAAIQEQRTKLPITKGMFYRNWL